MFKRYLIAFALIAGLATLANAQAPAPWTKVGMLRCGCSIPALALLLPATSRCSARSRRARGSASL